MAFRVKFGPAKEQHVPKPQTGPDLSGDAGSDCSSPGGNVRGRGGRRRRGTRMRGASRWHQYDKGDDNGTDEESDGSCVSDRDMGTRRYSHDQGAMKCNFDPRQSRNEDGLERQSSDQKRQAFRGAGRGGRGTATHKGNETHRVNENHEDDGREDSDKASDVSQGPAISIPDVDPDEWIKVFNLLLNQFNGRTKLGTLMCSRGGLLQGFTYQQAAYWLKRSKHFRVLEKNGLIKSVSIHSTNVRRCFNYKQRNTHKCHNDKCPFFHVCGNFVNGTCSFGSSCGFSHSFLDGSNAVVCEKAGLQEYNNEEIRIIVFRSAPVVCDKFNSGGCNDDCPDLHVCAGYIRKECSDENCKLGHVLRGTDHNDWVLNTFHLQKIFPSTLYKMVITHRTDPTDGCDQKTSRPDPSNSVPVDKAMAHKGTRDQPMAGDHSSNDTVSTATRNKSAFVKKPEYSVQPKAGAPEKQEPTTHARGCTSEQNPTTSKRGFFLKAQKASSVMERTPESQSSTASAGGDTHGEKSSAAAAGGGRVEKAEQTEGIEPLSAGGQAKKGRRGERQVLPASDYNELCELHTWTGRCQRGRECPRYHHPDRCPFVWQLRLFSTWQEVSHADSIDIEERFCALAARGEFQVILPSVGGLQIAVDFNLMVAMVSDGSDQDSLPVIDVRRWSIPSYVDAEADTTLNLYCQWVWYCKSSGQRFAPYVSGFQQYTLEEKYLRGQHKYYFEDGNEKRFLVLFKEMKLIDLGRGSCTPLLRRPFQSLLDPGATVPLMASVLLHKCPTVHQSDLPKHWCTVDRFQHFELVELNAGGAEYRGVEASFHDTVHRSRVSIVHIFRVQNPSLWDKFCSTKRGMAPREGHVGQVREEELFHGTPSLLAARGICTNNIDFRRAGENAGAVYGQGSYFSTTASYSHNYTQRPDEDNPNPDRFMFRAKVLVGEYIRGHQSYKRPPVREGLKNYDSCVDNVDNPTIFVIFDLAQSYPEYLIQYRTTELQPAQHVHASRPAPTTVSGYAGQGRQPLTTPTTVRSATTVYLGAATTGSSTVLYPRQTSAASGVGSIQRASSASSRTGLYQHPPSPPSSRRYSAGSPSSAGAVGGSAQASPWVGSPPPRAQSPPDDRSSQKNSSSRCVIS
ncbi:uncharacterized protein LOC143287760 [Babylonia areolata]|uniref:uncharacterized protein LOC143287760 n=1 Tax=Babylonia areolata TaxID=304850 RepID=UPI003FD2A444